jgi:hypothetical protein
MKRDSVGLFMNILLLCKDLFWKIVPQKIGSRIVAMYFNRKKFKKADWMLLNLYITGKCNLNCIGCNAFAPIATDYVLDVIRFESDIKRLSELIGYKIDGAGIGAVWGGGG